MTSPIALVFTIRMFTGRIRLPRSLRAQELASSRARQASMSLHLHIQRADLLAGDELFPVISERILPQGFEPQGGVDHFVHTWFVDAACDARRKIDAVLLNHMLKFAHVFAVVLI